MTDQHVRYWAAQVRELVTEDVTVTPRHEQGDVIVKLPDEDNTREERASLIQSLERAGITIESSVRLPTIRVDTSADPLEYPHDGSVTYE